MHLLAEIFCGFRIATARKFAIKWENKSRKSTIRQRQTDTDTNTDRDRDTNTVTVTFTITARITIKITVTFTATDCMQMKLNEMKSSLGTFVKCFNEFFAICLDFK